MNASGRNRDGKYDVEDRVPYTARTSTKRSAAAHSLEGAASHGGPAAPESRGNTAI